MATTPLTKTGYTDKYAGTTSVKIDMNSDGNIAQPGEAVAATKRFTFRGVNSTNTLQDNTTVIAAFLSFANGTQDSLSNRASVTWEVA